MSDTLRFNLPLLDAAQAQKHVTVNEALVRTDAVGARRAESKSLTTPPAALDGEVHIVGTGSSGDWAGQDNALAIFTNGGWDFVAPWSGLLVWIEDEGANALFTEAGWITAPLSGSTGGAQTIGRVVEIDHTLTVGASSTTVAAIPDKAIVLGVTARVAAEITGATTWSLGVSGSPDRYGSGFGTAQNSFAHGVTGQPQAYFGATPLVATAAGGDFTGGALRIAVHILEIAPPVSI